MKADELMIGDWVGYLPTWKNEDGTIGREGNPNNPMICKVEMLGSSGAQLYNGEDYFDADDIELYPIPLTPEILKKNGFKDAQFYAELLWNDAFQIISDCASLSIRCKNSDLSLSIPCDTVHELQHTLRLCGIKKEIIL